MRDQIELEIIVDSLKRVGIDVPVTTVARWSISTCADVEQWATREHWRGLKKLPADARRHLKLPCRMPSVLRKYKQAMRLNMQRS